MNTMQQEFDAVVQHLCKQGRPATSGDSCKYRTPDGLMCAVGCRIPDDMYSPAMEGNVVYQLIKALGDVLPQEIVTYEDMFDDLQWAHDCWDQDESFSDAEFRFKEIAAKHNLTYNDPRSAQ